MGAFHLTMKVQFVEGNLKLGLRPSDTALAPRCINFKTAHTLANSCKTEIYKYEI